MGDTKTRKTRKNNITTWDFCEYIQIFFSSNAFVRKNNKTTGDFDEYIQIFSRQTRSYVKTTKQRVIFDEYIQIFFGPKRVKLVKQVKTTKQRPIGGLDVWQTQKHVKHVKTTLQHGIFANISRFFLVKLVRT